MLWTKGRFPICFLIFISATVMIPRALAEEPAKRFLKRLQEEGYFELGLKYLEINAAKNRLPKSLQADLPLERNILLQQSLRTLKTKEQREERMLAIEKGYKEFLASSPNHSRRSETQTSLGDLYLARAQAALEESKNPDNVVSSESWRSKSRQAYTDALELFNRIAEELKPLLTSMDGDKIKTVKIEGKNLAELKELREQYRDEYRNAQILQAKTMEFLSQTYAPASPEWRKWLESAEKSLGSLVEKMTGREEAGRRMLSLKYLAETQQQLGKIDEARNSLTRVADNEGEGVFRTYRVQAIASIIRLDASEKVAKYEAAVQRGDEALKGMSPRERDEPEWLDLQLALAEARIAWGKTIDEKKDDNKFRNNRKAARELLQGLVKKKGPHLAKAKQSLGELGIETAEKVDDKLPITKAWADTIKAARERLDRAESTESTLPILQQQLAGESADKQSINSQIQSIQDAAVRDRQQAIQLYQRAFKLFRETDSRDDLIEAKFLSTYLYFKTEQNWEAIALAQELLVSGRGNSTALRAGGFAVMSLGKLLSEASAETQLAIMPSIAKLATQLNDADPTAKEAQSAVDLLVKLDLIHKRFDDAEKHIALGKGNSSGGGASMLGQILWSEYQRAAIEHRKNKTSETPEEQNLKTRAEALLRATWDAMAADKADRNMVTGVNALASIYLMSDRIDEALSIIDTPTKGAVALANSVKDLDPNVQLEAYRLKLQAMVQAAGSGKQPLSSENVTQVVQKMKELAAGNDTMLTSALNNLAVKLQVKLEASKSIEDQSKLGGAFGVLIQQLITVSSDVATLDSVGSAILTLASKMQRDPVLSTNAKPLMLIAEAAFTKVSSKPAAELLEAKRKPEDLQLKLALAKSGAGKFEEAHALFAQSLATNPNNLRSQVDAARNLQLWANGKDAVLLKKAISGAEPDAKKVNAIWGWAKINTKTASRVSEYKETFFEAQLNIAKVWRDMAMLESAPTAKTQGLEKALGKIRETHQFYKDLGSPEIRTNFDKLLRQIQQDLGLPVAGLLAFEKT